MTVVVNLKRQNLSVLFEKEDQNNAADSNADSLASIEDVKEGEVEEVLSVESNKKKPAPKSSSKPKQKGQQAVKKPASKPVVEKEIAKPISDENSESEDENSNDESHSKSRMPLTLLV